MNMSQKQLYKPQLIIHGGAGNINRDNLPPDLWRIHKAALRSILESTKTLLQDGANSLSAAVHAVKLFEENPLYNCGRGAVFTRSGTIELEASVMVSSGRRKRGAAVSLIKHVKHPIELAAEILRTGDDDFSGAQGHVHLSGTSAEELASAWNLELCEESHFWTRKRWQEHRRSLDRSWQSSADMRLDDIKQPDGSPWPQDDPSWNGLEYLPQGTVGCVAMDRYGVVAVATSTGGLTNKLAGRIGDTPTFGAGFWAEQWRSSRSEIVADNSSDDSLHGLDHLHPFKMVMACMSPLSDATNTEEQEELPLQERTEHAVALSGTGNGDSFLRLSAARTAAALTRFADTPSLDLAKTVTWMTGPGGELQRSAGDRWGRTGEGAGGIIGIERINARTKIVADFNCGGLIRAWYDDMDVPTCQVFHEAYDHVD